MDSFLDDLRVGARVLAKERGLAAVVVCLLALGIAANTALFSLVDAILFRPLPHAEPQRLVQVWESAPAAGLRRFGVSAPAWQTRSEAFAGLVASAESSANLAGPDRPQRVRVARVAGDLGSVFGATPLLGPRRSRPWPGSSASSRSWRATCRRGAPAASIPSSPCATSEPRAPGPGRVRCAPRDVAASGATRAGYSK